MTTTAAGGAGDLPASSRCIRCGTVHDASEPCRQCQADQLAERLHEDPTLADAFSSLLLFADSYAASARAAAIEECATVCEEMNEFQTQQAAKGGLGSRVMHMRVGYANLADLLAQKIRALLPQPGSNADEGQP